MDAKQAGQIAFRVPLIRSAHRLIVDAQAHPAVQAWFAQWKQKS
ncbi:hypothetical protein [Brevibacillus parabrevis]|nr:hypothetical protein [Brevibacillus parabrevis]